MEDNYYRKFHDRGQNFVTLMKLSELLLVFIRPFVRRLITREDCSRFLPSKTAQLPAYCTHWNVFIVIVRPDKGGDMKPST